MASMTAEMKAQLMKVTGITDVAEFDKMVKEHVPHIENFDKTFEKHSPSTCSSSCSRSRLSPRAPRSSGGFLMWSKRWSMCTKF